MIQEDVEAGLIRSYVAQTHLIIAIQRSQADMNSTRTTLSGVLLRCLDYFALTAREEMNVIKRDLYRQRIRIEDAVAARTSGLFEYRCRDRVDTVELRRDEIQAEVSARMARYMQAVSASFRGKQRA
ncbi:hypothetical protein [Paenibacillus sp. PAMC21692]|uniref:hypothetical protein n=1 Tax=Paenibacillus sp. PAMC21692 TaxID=2762320 RepID=UPI00164D90D6|nr:hypothetical protein [Paenibacillus sp. PAMC21692]QNK54583.1 hypothetical protein H7F31_18150 [Paenibacillus sp. PAMC21692]